MSPEPSAADTAVLQHALGDLEQVVLDQRRRLRLALACVLARGHLLIEDVPGLGKTVLAQAIARVLGLDFRRVQFTSDLLPADITGASVWERERGEFRFVPGPVFAELLLADEVNRSSPKTQSALLEAMEERQVTVDGRTHRLAPVFFVVATQNPLDNQGAHPLPEAQLDRFLMRLDLGYPGREAELALLAGEDRRELLERTAPRLDAGALRALQQRAAAVHAAPALLEYLWRLLAATRSAGTLRCGLSPRAGLALLAAARAWAFLDGRPHVLPADLQAVWLPVTAHRVACVDGGDTRAVLERLLGEVETA
ncbi:AAA family ATPase [Rubrivivax gelatinosus]|uniref:MoxR-like ATPase n=1 Tax=Rubrivivax gelatinosus TaxID=28068 RepID=A0A4V6NPY7_RUBGE|nr:AAA family ATPase [Rubrivivax gelatinosus]MBK1690493.1 AAA family ATPase [Rubrivivax gelatinosus]TCP01508.1 MoxR-like ATPase [Rubrivivax gelatinosus]